MGDKKEYSDQYDFQFVQNLFDHSATEFVSPELRAKVLSSAPKSVIIAGFTDLLNSLWPFGSLWPPAAALSTAAIFGIMLGLSSHPSTVNDISTVDEEIIFSISEINEKLEEIE